jgi:hypothetical protein
VTGPLYRRYEMEGLRKLLATAAVLLLETFAFAFAALITKTVDAGMLTAYFVAVAAALAIYTSANVVSKFSPPSEPPKP